MAELSPTPDGPHGPGCNGIGKYDCSFDETVDGSLFYSEGDSEAPTGWWATVDLDAQDSEDAPLIEHYGALHLIIGGSSQGFVKVVAFPSADLRRVMLDQLEEQFSEWYDQDGDQL